MLVLIYSNKFRELNESLVVGSVMFEDHSGKISRVYFIEKQFSNSVHR